jgi:hypothetical protein
MLSLLFAACLLQEPTLDDLVRSLSSDDVAVRDKATRDLGSMGLDKLPQMEKHLRDPNAELASRVRIAMGYVLSSKLGSREPRFEMRPAAPEATTDAWIAAGADQNKLPEGYEARRVHPSSNIPDQNPWILVGPPVAGEGDVVAAEPEPDMERPAKGGIGWVIRFELGPEAAARFDKLAAELFALVPRGKVAILLDGGVLAAPQINAQKFGGKGVVQGDFPEAEARKIARVLKGKWLESSMRAEKDGNASTGPEKAAEFLKGTKGFDQVTIKPDATGLDVSGFLDLKEVDLVSVWQSLRERGYRLAPKK